MARLSGLFRPKNNLVEEVIEYVFLLLLPLVQEFNIMAEQHLPCRVDFIFKLICNSAGILSLKPSFRHNDYVKVLFLGNPGILSSVDANSR